MDGKFYLLGVGPGDPELVTLKAQRILRQAAAVAVPMAKKEKESVALQVVREFLPEGCEILPLLMPMTRDEAQLKEAWQIAAKQVHSIIQTGGDVAFVTIGDPALYSTGMYLLQELKALDPLLRCETVPGVTSFNACAARLDLPLALGNEPLLVVPYVVDKGSLKDLLIAFPNLILLKVTSNYPEIVASLEELELLDKAVYISRCGQKQEYISYDLKALLEQELDYLSLIIIRREGVQ